MSDAFPSTSPASAPGIDTEHTAAGTTNAPVVPETSATASTTNGTDITTQIQSAGNTALNSESQPVLFPTKFKSCILTRPAAQATLSSISNSKAVQDIKNGQALDLHPAGPVAQNVSAEATKTSSELKDVYGNKAIPAEPAATGQPLTHYHSMFYRLLSWQSPRATSITFVGSLAFILAARYLSILHYVFKFSYFILGITASLEIAGKLLFNGGLASKMRPRQYYTIPRDSLERSLDDVEQLINFFVIEVQRVIYAENVYVTIGVFLSALVSYGLIQIVPVWGLAFISTCVLYLGPLIYIKNKDAIDNGIANAGEVVSSQATQIKNLTAEHTSKATESIKSATAEYTSKAQEYIGAKKNDASSGISGNDFPAAPKQEPVIGTTSAQQEPLVAH